MAGENTIRTRLMYSPKVDGKAISDEGDVIKMELAEAEGHLGQLIEEAAAGKEVVITGKIGRTVRLVPLSSEAGEGPEQQAVASSGKTIGHALDRFIGTWTAEEEAEVLEAVEVFEHVNESFCGSHDGGGGRSCHFRSTF